MLWSLFKILLFVAAIVALAFGVQWLLTQTGEVLVTFGGTEFVLTPIALVLGLIVLLAALWVLFLLVGFLAHIPDALFRRHADTPQGRALQDVSPDSRIGILVELDGG